MRFSTPRKVLAIGAVFLLLAGFAALVPGATNTGPPAAEAETLIPRLRAAGLVREGYPLPVLIGGWSAPDAITGAAQVWLVGTDLFDLHYREVWTYLYALAALVITFDIWSGAIRRRLVGHALSRRYK